jgi:predicted acylesterase/phospholipase RssA
VSSARLVEIGADAADDTAVVPVSYPLTPRNVLVLSGGGMNGAYTAGVLKGWTASGTRPPLDVVTGISTGALIAPFAFLGPAYDAELERLYTSMRQADIYARRLRINALASSEPLQRQITASVTDELLHNIAAAHRQGRRLYVGTTNLDTKRLVVWDLGAIAARNSAQSAALFRAVLLASCSIPGLLPPVPINVQIDGRPFTELHVDGGVTASVFLQPAMLGIGPNGERPAEDHRLAVRVIVAGKLYPEAAPAEDRLLSISGESINAVLQARMEGDLTQVVLLTRYAGGEVRLAAVRQDFPIGASSMSFDTQTMRALFDDGYRGAASGTAWQAELPGIETVRLRVPRTGTSFATVLEGPAAPPWRPDQIRIITDGSGDGSPRRPLASGR